MPPPTGVGRSAPGAADQRERHGDGRARQGSGSGLGGIAVGTVSLPPAAVGGGGVEAGIEQVPARLASRLILELVVDQATREDALEEPRQAVVEVDDEGPA